MADLRAWTDLLDPSEGEIRRHAPESLTPEALAQLLRPASPEGNARPTMQGHGDYVFGVLLVAVAVPDEDRLFYQEVDLVLSRETVLTVRKTPDGEAPFDPAAIRAVCEAKRDELSPGMIALHVVDDIAERYLDILDAVDDEIDEIDEHVDDWPAERTRKRLSDVRHDLLHLRRTLAPTRDAVRGIVDGRVDLRTRALFGHEVFPEEVERQFTGAYDKLLRAAEALEFSRDLLAAVRDYHQARIAHDQNEIVKRLTAIASLLLFPTFWVGVYGQNFEHMPELGWRLGYLYSWLVIAVTTVLQLIYFRRKRWL
jgi:magnesium transporter